ncbi:MAG TPA: M81 family metallopeptidase [Stellaceae bacterium]|nr:M81 family metallopeptidase [Stellaceae bacterium]
MARIAIGGLHHETNTFAPLKATYEEFQQGGGWPGIQRGQSFFTTFKGMNLPISGAIDVLAGHGHTLVPLVWAAATPSAHVTEDAYERILAPMLEDLRAAGSLDGIFLDLHGAMVTEHLDDGEGELLRRVRAVVGRKIPIVTSLDLHANVTEQMIDFADVMVAYRTYPHVDMADTGKRAAEVLHGLLSGGEKPNKALNLLPFLIPLPWQCTMTEPGGAVYRDLERIERDTGVLLSFTPGFPAADFRDCGGAIFGYGEDPGRTRAAVQALTAAISAREGEFAGTIYDADAGVAEALRRPAGKPIVLADTQDNPGAGGSSDTVGLLEALVRARAPETALAVMWDPASAAAAHAAGKGATVTLDLGGKSGAPGQRPFHGSFVVEALGTGEFQGTGPMYGGAHMKLGPMALLRIGGVRVVTATRKVQAADQAIFRHLGVEPTTARILALKSSVHFRADFDPIAQDILVVKAPGAMLADPLDFPFKRLRPGIRLRPLGPAFAA